MSKLKIDDLLLVITKSQAAKILLDMFPGPTPKDKLDCFISDRARTEMPVDDIFRTFIFTGVRRIAKTPSFHRLFNVEELALHFQIHPTSVAIGLGLVYHYSQLRLWNPEWFLISVTNAIQTVDLEAIKIIERIESGRLFTLDRFLFRKILLVVFTEIRKFFGALPILEYTIAHKLSTLSEDELIQVIRSPLSELAILLHVPPSLILESMTINPQKYIGFE